VTKFALDKALKLVAPGVVTFDERSVVHRVVPEAQTPEGNPTNKALREGLEVYSYFSDPLLGPRERSFYLRKKYCFPKVADSWCQCVN